jgi:hypothetical protein
LEKVCLIFLAVFASHKLYGSYVHAFISGWCKNLHKFKYVPLGGNFELVFKMWISISGVKQQLVSHQKGEKKCAVHFIP